MCVCGRGGCVFQYMRVVSIYCVSDRPKRRIAIASRIVSDV